MALITCPECGRQVSDKAAACPQCGYPINAAPVQAVPQKDSSKELMLARRALDEKNFEDAERYFSQAYEIDPFDWEASFFKSYCQTVSGKNPDAVANSLPNVKKLIDGISDEEKKKNAFITVFTLCANYADFMYEKYMESARYSAFEDPYKNLAHAMLDNLPAGLPDDLAKRVADGIVRYAEMLTKSMDRLISSARSW